MKIFSTNMNESTWLTVGVKANVEYVITDQLCKATDSSSDFHQPPVVAITRHVSICGSGRNCRWKVVSSVHLYTIRQRLCEKLGNVPVEFFVDYIKISREWQTLP